MVKLSLNKLNFYHLNTSHCVSETTINLLLLLRYKINDYCNIIQKVESIKYQGLTISHIAYHTFLELFEELPKGQMLSLQVYIHSVIEYAAVILSPYSYMHMYCHIRLVEMV